MLFPFTISQTLLLILIILILIPFTIFILLPWLRLKKYKNKGLVTFFFPILGYLRYWSLGFAKSGDYFACFKNASKESPNQKVLVTNFSHNTVFLLRDPEYNKEFFQHHQFYNKVGIIDFMKPLSRNGLVFVEGDIWKQHRKVISNSFHYESLKANVPAVHRTAKEFFDKIKPEEYKDFPVINKVQEITGEIVGITFFGESLNSYEFEGKNLTLALAELVSDVVIDGFSPLSLFLGTKLVNLVPSHRRLMKRVKAFRKVIHGIIQERKAAGKDRKDLLAVLLSTQDAKDPKERLSDDDIIDEFIALFAGGMDTTGHLIGMTLYNLLVYPEYLEKLQKEREVAFNKEEITSLDTLQAMEELHCLLKETLRFYTPAPMMFDRVALQDHKIGDLNIPKGTWVKPDFCALFFDQKYFDQPEKFNPEIWKKNSQTMNPYVFTPFAAGSRNCIGQHLAMIEGKVIVSEFLERFEYKLKEGYELKMVFRFLNEPYDELLFDLTPRK